MSEEDPPRRRIRQKCKCLHFPTLNSPHQKTLSRPSELRFPLKFLIRNRKKSKEIWHFYPPLTWYTELKSGRKALFQSAVPTGPALFVFLGPCVAQVCLVLACVARAFLPASSKASFRQPASSPTQP